MAQLTQEEIKTWYANPKRVVPDIVLPLHDLLADLIIAYDPISIFEFGCNRGVNLKNISGRKYGISMYGCDVNPEAVKLAKKITSSVVVGDESYLEESPDCDIYFTSSVLNHLPEIDGIISLMKKACNKYVVLLEAVTIPEGRRWFKHDYDKYGFSLQATVESKEAGCLYGLFSWSKANGI